MQAPYTHYKSIPDFQNPAHSVFFIPELLQAILDPLLDSPDDPSTDVDSAALVCRTWRDPALNVKWRDTYSKPLLSIFGPLDPVYYLENSTEEVADEWVFKSPLRMTDWKRFDKIAKRVKTLRSSQLIPLSDSVIKSLFIERPDISTPILPRLEELVVLDGPDVMTMMLFAPKNLKVLSVDFFLEDASMESFTDRTSAITFAELIPTRFPKLTELRLASGRNVASVMNRLTPTIPQLQSLRKVKLTSIVPSPDCVENLADLPDLQRLDLWLQCMAQAPWDFKAPQSPGAFPALVDLSCTVAFTEGMTGLPSSYQCRSALTAAPGTNLTSPRR